MKRLSLTLALSLLFASTAPTWAATVFTTYDSTPYTLSNSDLLGQPVVVTGWDQSSNSYGSGTPTSGTLHPVAGPGSGYVAAMVDGLWGVLASDDMEGGGNLLAAGRGTTYAATNYHYLRLALDKAYNLTQIDVFSWSPDFRVEQNFKVFYQAGGVDWFELATAGNFTDDMAADLGKFYGKSSITDLGVSGITALEFRFFSIRDGVDQWARYREIDVYGSEVVVPEPASLGLLAAGALLLLSRRRQA